MAQPLFNSAKRSVTIYRPDGTPHECSRLNAIDLIRHNGYQWTSPVQTSSAAIEAATKTEEPAPAPVPEAPVEEQKPEEKTSEEPRVDHINEPLPVVAKAISGDDDVEKYLDGFTEDALRSMASERYELRIHGKAQKPKIIEKILEAEYEKFGE